MDKLLKLLDTDARLTNAQLAVMLDKTEAEVAARSYKGCPSSTPLATRSLPAYAGMVSSIILQDSSAARSYPSSRNPVIST